MDKTAYINMDITSCYWSDVIQFFGRFYSDSQVEQSLQNTLSSLFSSLSNFNPNCLKVSDDDIMKKKLNFAVSELIKVGGKKAVDSEDVCGMNLLRHVLYNCQKPDGWWLDRDREGPFDSTTIIKVIEVGGKELLLKEDQDGNNALHDACKYVAGVEVITKMIEVGGRDLLMKKNRFDMNPHHEACGFGANVDVITKLIQEGGEEILTYVDELEMNVLQHACDKWGGIEVLTKLITVGGKELVRHKAKNGMNSLHYACNSGSDITVVLQMIEVGGQDLIMETDDKLMTSLHHTVVGNNCHNVFSKLIELGGRELLLKRDLYGKNALYYYIESRKFDVEFAKQLIGVGGEELLIQSDGRYQNLLQSLIFEIIDGYDDDSKEKYFEITSFLIDKGIKYSIGGEFGIGGLFEGFPEHFMQHPFWLSWERNFIPSLQQSFTAQPNDPNNNTVPILQAAIIHKAPLFAITSTLAELNCVNIKDSSNRYPLDVGIEYGLTWHKGVKNIAEKVAETQGRPLLNVCAEHGLQWENGMSTIMSKIDISAFDTKDDSSGLFPFMLAAMGQTTDLNSLFKMTKKSVHLVKLYDYGDVVKSSSLKRKRTEEVAEIEEV